jgi:hypothetical protein
MASLVSTNRVVYRENCAIDLDRSASKTQVGIPCAPRLLAIPNPTKFPPRTIAPGRFLSVLMSPISFLAALFLGSKGQLTERRLPAIPAANRGPAFEVPVTNRNVGPKVFSPTTPAM